MENRKKSQFNFCKRKREIINYLSLEENVTIKRINRLLERILIKIDNIIIIIRK